jgi:hypothetical protein
MDSIPPAYLLAGRYDNLTLAGGINCLESIPGLFKRLQIQAQSGLNKLYAGISSKNQDQSAETKISKVGLGELRKKIRLIEGNAKCRH